MTTTSLRRPIPSVRARRPGSSQWQRLLDRLYRPVVTPTGPGPAGPWPGTPADRDRERALVDLLWTRNR